MRRQSSLNVDASLDLGGLSRVPRRVNRMSRLREFMRSWENPLHPDNSATVKLGHTKYGNINSTGTVGDYRGYALSRWHPRFADALEPRVKELVLLLALRFRWVTYSSCQGHYYGIQGLAPVERHVGIIPRSGSELNMMIVLLRRVAAQVKRQRRFSAVYLDIVTEELETKGSSSVVIDVYFRRRWWATWRMYFSALDEVYKHTVHTLESQTQFACV